MNGLYPADGLPDMRMLSELSDELTDEYGVPRHRLEHVVDEVVLRAVQTMRSLWEDLREEASDGRDNIETVFDLVLTEVVEVRDWLDQT
jgi:hypothetical protein